MSKKQTINLSGVENPDTLEINGVQYVVVVHECCWVHTPENEGHKNDDVEMMITLAKVGDDHYSPLSPNYRINYIAQRPHEMQFYIYDKKKKDYVEHAIKTIRKL